MRAAPVIGSAYPLLVVPWSPVKRKGLSESSSVSRIPSRVAAWSAVEALDVDNVGKGALAIAAHRLL